MDRRDFVASSAAAAAALPLLNPLGTGPHVRQGTILPLTSTSDVFAPARGRAFQKFSFDFPEPSVEFAGLKFGFLVFTRENAYALDAAKITVTPNGDRMDITATGLVWAGGQEKAPGRVVAHLQKNGDVIEWTVTAEMSQPIKAVTTVLRGVPRGQISTGSDWQDTRDNELLYGYPFGAGDLWGGNTAQSLNTPFVAVKGADGTCLALSSLDDNVRAKRFYFQPGETGYRVELVHEVEGWLTLNQVTTAPWRVARTPTLELAVQPHYDHLERAFHLTRWEQRQDVPAWLRRTALVVTLHGMHYTGFIFNDYAKQLEILRWIATLIPPERVLVFLSAWDGRYYWDYPNYVAPARMGGEVGLKRLVSEGQRLGFKFMLMFGANAANRNASSYASVASAATYRQDGERFDITWVDWDNDRHQEGWLSYMNLGVPAWRDHLSGRIGDAIERYGVDAYFLDINAGWMNNTEADMHEGQRQLVQHLRASYPSVLCCGEFMYDALAEFTPLYHVYVPRMVPFARFFSHLSHPAPGRGSSGVHEAGFGRFDPATLGLAKRDGLIPTLQVVDDTFTKYRDQMAAIIRQAREWSTG
jgi:hypothetical protein